MAAKYRSAYPDILLVREKVSIANVAAGPSGKDRNARFTMRDNWDTNDRGRPMYRSEDPNPVVHQEVGGIQARGTQKNGETQVPKSRQE
ncbi:hypothetical protein PoB_000014100 [Plakobranchus ocellatus]|uniref:Uncharacterized protein n=1 Tax=Plakobranchus ocellatus TaxID=259542 RepID=A0AAV3XQW4_9GAST|nr:hypothetical protein PoB_000014100 [Plakobranchus ocellatus]